MNYESPDDDVFETALAQMVCAGRVAIAFKRAVDEKVEESAGFAQVMRQETLAEENHEIQTYQQICPDPAGLFSVFYAQACRKPNDEQSLTTLRNGARVNIVIANHQAEILLRATEGGDIDPEETQEIIHGLGVIEEAVRLRILEHQGVHLARLIQEYGL